MKVILYDKFNPEFIAAVYDGVKDHFEGEIYFKDGNIQEYDSRYYGVEVEAESEE